MSSSLHTYYAASASGVIKSPVNDSVAASREIKRATAARVCWRREGIKTYTFYRRLCFTARVKKFSRSSAARTTKQLSFAVPDDRKIRPRVCLYSSKTQCDTAIQLPISAAVRKLLRDVLNRSGRLDETKLRLRLYD